ncbi:NADPH-dependent oxidoreductase [Methylobacterium nonmethylotrophicum]|uniref:NADPH-dependent oxidoreductase n=1 Tax=Methylobacterium nonmethylotrophicum TaxID=1141884 RepID=A0A4Z0NP40_9HYPH|nr:NADPH-dependent oxidoreductase [Methylobacterium nonmethylotrophicum]TGD98589.1 NADPH-dependent oxidoreductase [Methylobacterium nonmethylotrophicum]
MSESERREALRARYGTEGGPDIAWNDVIAGLLAHRTVRAFRPDPLPAGTLETLVAAAQSAASSSNLQTWSVVAVEDEAAKRRLSEVARGQRHIVEAPLVLVWLADLSRLEAIGRDRDAPTEGLDYLEMLMVGVVDAALAAQNATVALESLGLGSVYIGALRNDPEAVADLLGLPPNVLAVFGLCVGWPDPERPAAVKPRLPQGVVLHRGRYDDALAAGPIGTYDAAMRAFQAGQRIPEVGWSGAAIERVRGPGSLSGRDRLRGILERRGFGLK